MDNGLIVLAVFVVVFAAVILWKKYGKKEDVRKMGGGSGGSGGKKGKEDSSYQ